jgi:hypothetical protein
MNLWRCGQVGTISALERLQIAELYSLPPPHRVLGMKQLIGLLTLFALSAATGNSQNAGKTVPTFVIQRPTIVAFFAPAKQSDNDADTNEVLGDFQLYATRAHPHLEKAGIDFIVATTVSFRVRTGMKLRSFRTGKIGVGYYFIAPDKEPHVEYGVMTDTDLLDRARQYFGMAFLDDIDRGEGSDPPAKSDLPANLISW